MSIELMIPEFANKNYTKKNPVRKSGQGFKIFNNF